MAEEHQIEDVDKWNETHDDNATETLSYRFQRNSLSIPDDERGPMIGSQPYRLQSLPAASYSAENSNEREFSTSLNVSGMRENNYAYSCNSSIPNSSFHSPQFSSAPRRQMNLSSQYPEAERQIFHATNDRYSATSSFYNPTTFSSKPSRFQNNIVSVSEPIYNHELPVAYQPNQPVAARSAVRSNGNFYNRNSLPSPSFTGKHRGEDDLFYPYPNVRTPPSQVYSISSIQSPNHSPVSRSVPFSPEMQHDQAIQRYPVMLAEFDSRRNTINDIDTSRRSLQRSKYPGKSNEKEHIEGKSSKGSKKNKLRGNSEQYVIDPVKVEKNEDSRQFLMIKNIPNSITQEKLYNILESFVQYEIEFLYLPMDKVTECNLGYGYVSLLNSSSVLKLYRAMHMKRWPNSSSVKQCEIVYARIQGHRDYVKMCEKWAIMSENPKYHPIFFKRVECYNGNTKETRMIRISYEEACAKSK